MKTFNSFVIFESKNEAVNLDNVMSLHYETQVKQTAAGNYGPFVYLETARRGIVVSGKEALEFLKYIGATDES